MSIGIESVPVHALLEAMVVASEQHPRAGLYLQQIVVEIDHPLDVGAFANAFEIVVGRHDALRTVLHREAGHVLVALLASNPPALEVIDHRDLPATEQDRLHTEELARERREGLLATTGADRVPLRARLVLLGTSRARFVLSFHHALLDGRSHTALLEELFALQDGDATASTLSPAPSSLEYSAWRSAQGTHSDAYWRETLAGCNGSGLLPFASLPGRPRRRAASTPVLGVTSLSRAETAALEEIARRHEVTVNTLVQSAWALLLARHAGRDDIVFGTTRACRHGGPSGSETTLGLLVNTAPMRITVAPDMPLIEVWRHARAQHLALRDHELTPLPRIRHALELAPEVPLFDTTLVFERYRLDEHLRRHGGRWAQRRVSLVERTDGATIAAYHGERLSLVVDAGLQPLAQREAQEIAWRTATILRGFLSHAEGRVRDLPLLAGWERRRALRVPAPPAGTVPVLDRVLDVARSQPEAIAVEDGARRVSYGELLRHADALAARLAAHGIARGSYVGIVADRGLEAVVAMLAAWRAGATWIAFDAQEATERLRAMIADAPLALLLVDPRVGSPPRPPSLPKLAIDLAAPARAGSANDPHDAPFTPARISLDDPAFALFTSGTTGRPKLAQNDHRGVSIMLLRTLALARLGPADRVFTSSPPAFDAALLEILMALGSGATLVITPWEAMRPGRPLADFLVRERITAGFITPTTLASLPDEPYPDWRVIVCGGEPIPASVVDRFGGGRIFLNIYGPTETSVWVSTIRCHPGEGKPTVGRVIRGTSMVILDEHGEPVPAGVSGDLWLAGSAVGHGYFANGARVPARFPAPATVVTTDAGPRWYRTGDLARRLPDGRFDILGRLDRQVKVGGRRVELEEIEAMLAGLDGVEAVAVGLLPAEHAAEKQLIAHVQPVAGATITPDALTRGARERLVRAFVPARWDIVRVLPRTARGKVDRSALAERTRAILRGDGAPERRALPDARREEVLVRWNQRFSAAAPGETALARFQRWAQSTPDQVAVQDEYESLSYAALDERAGRLASWLLSRGVLPEDRVAVLAPASAEQIVALLAIGKARAAYVPLDPAYPAERVSFVAESSGARFVLLGRGVVCEAAPDSSPRVPIAGALAEAAALAPVRDARVDDTALAYVIYTSGSTGQPKGVAVEQRSLTNLVQHYERALALETRDRVSAAAGVAFDASVADIWPALSCGATVVIPPKDVKRDVRALCRWIQEARVTVSFLSTPVAELAFREPWPASSALRVLLTGGEALRMAPAAPLPFRVINTYGPTECTVDTTWAEVPSGPDAPPGPPPIGHAIAGTRVYVLDERGDPVDVGEEGELYVGGICLARGYLGRDDLTRERFVGHALPEEPGARLYRTGDLVAWREDGELEFFGRIDRQVQIRGVRVELGEIESALMRHPAIEQASVALVGDATAPGGGLVAWVVAREGAALDAETVLAHARTSLPAEMVPRAVVLLDALPLTANGKVDRDHLPLPRAEAEAAPLPEGTPGDVLGVFREVLARPDLGPDDDFFDHGGDSLSGVRALLEIETRTGFHLSFAVLSQISTARGLAERIDAGGCGKTASIVRTLRVGKDPIHWILVPGAGGGVHWFRDLADRLRPGRAVIALETMAMGNGAETGALTMEGAAKELVRALDEADIRGPFALAGYSTGGSLVFEMARHLDERGDSPVVVALLDTYEPRLVARRGFLPWRILLNVLALGPRGWAEIAREKIAWRRHLRSLTEQPRSSQRELAAALKEAHLAMDLAYAPRPWRGPLVVARCRRRPLSAPLDASCGWARLVERGVSTHVIPGDHYSMLAPPGADAIARLLDEALDAAIARPR